MGLETATYIEDLVETNPLGTDTKAQGDNHIRLIKKVLGNQFPNLGSEALDASAADINELFASHRAVPTGLISMWSGATTAIPDGWGLCDGSAGTPNLVGMFIVGSGSDVGGVYDVGDTGGSADINISGATEEHILTIDEIPSHSHTQGYTAIGGDGYDGSKRSSPGGDLATGSTGGGEGHSHDITYDGTGTNLPPYYALAYIIKL